MFLGFVGHIRVLLQSWTRLHKSVEDKIADTASGDIDFLINELEKVYSSTNLRLISLYYLTWIELIQADLLFTEDNEGMGLCQSRDRKNTYQPPAVFLQPYLKKSHQVTASNVCFLLHRNWQEKHHEPFTNKRHLFWRMTFHNTQSWKDWCSILTFRPNIITAKKICCPSRLRPSVQVILPISVGQIKKICWSFVRHTYIKCRIAYFWSLGPSEHSILHD